MARHIIVQIIIWCSALSIGTAQSKYISHEFSGNQLRITTDAGDYNIAALSDKIIRISFTGEAVHSDKVYAPVKSQPQPLKLHTSGAALTLSTKFIDLQVNKSPLTIQISYKDELKLSGLRFFTSGDTIGYRYLMKPDEQVYGTGARALPLNRRGYRFKCYNQANYGYGMGADFLNYSIPHMMSSASYMLLFDNPARAWFDIGHRSKDVFSFESLGGNASVYFFGDDTYNDLVSEYVSFTGRQPMPPFWALGNLQSRFGYRSQQQTENVVDSMLQAGYPLDAVILDIFWFGPEIQDGVMGNLDWDSVHWPDPEGMIQKFRSRGVKTILISEPFFTKKSKHFNYLKQHGLFGKDASGGSMTLPGFYFGDAGLLDVFKPKAEEWLWQQYHTLKQQGVEGWWCDLGEPEIHPDSMVHVNGPAREVHGIYGHNWTKVFYDNYRNDYPNARLFVLGRAGYAGSQRFGLIPWSGDVGRTWSGLRAQIPLMLGMGISGLAYMHSDAGGFASGTRNPELYTRWLQFAAFTPVFRPHSDSNAEPEPIYYADSIQKIVKSYIKLRYALLPYNYTLAWKNHVNGQLLAKPLFMVYDDPELSANDSIFFWGDNLLVVPVLQSGVTHQKVALPEGSWYNFHTGEFQTGNQIVDVSVTLSDIPVFVKAGSFIPMVKPVQTTDAYKTDTLMVHFYSDPSQAEASGKLYVDDGETFGSFEKKQYEIIEFERTTNAFEVKNNGSNFAGRPEQRVLEFVIHKPDFKKVKIDEKWMEPEYRNGTFRFYIYLNAGEDIKIPIR